MSVSFISRILKKYKVITFFILIFITYNLFGFGVAITNDSCTNSLQIKELDIFSRSSHFSFHLLGVIFYSILNYLFGTSSINSIEFLLACISTLGSFGLFNIIKQRSDDQKTAFIAVILYAFSSGIFRFSCRAEYLVFIPSLALISLALYNSKKYILSGFVYSLGFLSSPFIILFSPTFLLFNSNKTLFKKKNLIFIVGFVLTYLVAAYFTFESTISGSWSYSQVLYYYIDIIKNLDFLRIFAVWVYGYLRSFHILIFIAIPAIIYVYKYDKRLFWLFLFLLVFHLPAAIPEARYGAYQMTVYPLLSYVFSQYLVFLFNKKIKWIYIILPIFLGLNLFLVITERNYNKKIKKTYALLNQNPEIKDGTIIFTYKAVNPIRKLYAPRLNPISLQAEAQEKTLLSTPLSGYKLPEYKDIFTTDEDVYLIESGTMIPDDYLKEKLASFINPKSIKLKNFGLNKLNPYLHSREVILLNDYPVRVYLIRHSDN